MATIPFETVMTTADAEFIWAQQKTAWQYDRTVRGNPTCDIIRPTWTGADENTGVQGTRNDVEVFSDHSCYHDLIPDEVIAGSGGIFQPGAIEVVLYDIGELDLKDMIVLKDKQYYLAHQKYFSNSGRSELQCNPYYA